MLHVYIEGDGQPWLTPSRVARDPTSPRLVARELMKLDPHPALLLGRPCYHGLHDPACNVELWTHRRYSPEVIDSMEAALRSLIAERRVQRVVLIGYSGGGVLAVHLARRIQQTAAVITIAANLDLARWCAAHDYSPLEGSLEPVSGGPLSRSVIQFHLAGANDSNVAPGMIENAVAMLGGRVEVHARFDHTCCWSSIWRETLKRVDALTVSSSPLE
jgi:pimeloyl-ACP methyl ester carboxylesterase